MKNFLYALKRPLSKNTGSILTPFEYTLDPKTYKQNFTKSTEATVSSPAGLHNGHYIAAIQDEILTEVNAIFMRLPSQHDFPIDRWSSSVQCMLQKRRNVASQNHG